MVAELKKLEEAVDARKREVAQRHTSFAIYESGLNDKKIKLTDDINTEFAKVNMNLMEVVEGAKQEFQKQREDMGIIIESTKIELSGKITYATR